MQPWSLMHTCQIRKVGFWCQPTMPMGSDGRFWGPIPRWNNEILFWMLLQAGQAMEMTVKDPVLVHVLKETLRRWPTQELLGEFKAFWIHKHELFALKGFLQGKSYCYSWRMLLSHVNHVLPSNGRDCVPGNVCHAFWRVAWKLSSIKKPINECIACHAVWHCQPSWAVPKKKWSGICIDFWGPFQTENYLPNWGRLTFRMPQWEFILLRNTHCLGLCSLGICGCSIPALPRAQLPSWGQGLPKAASAELSHSATLSLSQWPGWTMLQATWELWESFGAPHNSVSHVCPESQALSELWWDHTSSSPSSASSALSCLRESDGQVGALGGFLHHSSSYDKTRSVCSKQWSQAMSAPK